MKISIRGWNSRLIFISEYDNSFQLVHLFQDLWRAFDHTVQYLSIINLVMQISKLYTNLCINILQQKPLKCVFITALIKQFIQMEEGENILFWERSWMGGSCSDER